MFVYSIYQYTYHKILFLLIFFSFFKSAYYFLFIRMECQCQCESIKCKKANNNNEIKNIKVKSEQILSTLTIRKLSVFQFWIYFCHLYIFVICQMLLLFTIYGLFLFSTELALMLNKFFSCFILLHLYTYKCISFCCHIFLIRQRHETKKP